MVRIPRHASAAYLRGAAALTAGAIALALLRRMLHKSSGPANRQPRSDTSFAAAPGAHGSVSESSERTVSGGANDERSGADLVTADGSALAASASQPAAVDHLPGAVSEPVEQKNTPVAEGKGSSRSTGQEHPAFAKRIRGYTSQGLVPVVWVLLVITAAFAAFGWVNRPDTSVPQPETGNIEVDFAHGNPAIAPVSKPTQDWPTWEAR